MTGPMGEGHGRDTRLLRVIAGLSLALTFVAGLAAGWALSQRGHGPRFGVRPGHGMGRPERGGPAGGGLERLNLTSAQRTAIDSVFHARRAQIDAFWQGPGRQLGAILDSTRADVRAVLDSSQRAAYDAMEARRRRFERGRGPGGPRGFRGPGAPFPDQGPPPGAPPAPPPDR